MNNDSVSSRPGKWAPVKNLFGKKPLAAAGLVFLFAMLVVAVLADVLAPYKITGGTLPHNILHMLEKPYPLMDPAERAAAAASGNVFWLGTDNLGVDILSYLIYGAYTSVILCLGVTALSTFISVAVGTSSAVIGGWFDLIVQRSVDAWQCIPGLLITVLIMSMFGNGVLQLILVMSVPGGIAGSRMIRSAAIAVKDSGYVKMSAMMGAGVFRKTLRHVLPNMLPIIITYAAGGLGGVIMMEASLNFLGYGVDVGTPSWGYMITHQGRANMYTAPWLILYPGVLITLMVLAANLFGDGLRDVLDPRLKGGVGSYSSKKTAELYAKYEKKRNRRRFGSERTQEKE
jgi:peptide/nickel transport system permease protein